MSGGLRRGLGAVAVWMCLGILVVPAAAAAEDIVVAVFPVSTVNFKASESLRKSMWAYVEAVVAETEGYRVIPHAALEAAIRKRHKSFLSHLYDPATQAEVGRQVAASQSVTTRVIGIGGRCKVNVTFFDIGRQVSTHSVGEEGTCSEAGVVDSIRNSIKKLRGSARPEPIRGDGGGAWSSPASVVREDPSQGGERGVGTLTVGIQPWGGYVGGPYFNGGLEPSERSRFWTDYHLDVRFELLESIPDSVKALRSGRVDVLWMTVDDLPTEYPQLESLRPLLFMLVGWSRGEESLVVRPSIRTLDDLEGKRIALEPETTAHSFLLISLDLAGLDIDDVSIVRARNDRHAADIFIRGDADAAMVWLEGKQRSLDQVPEAYVLESTRDASYLMAESLAVRSDVLERNRAAILSLTEGWLRANAEINEDIDGARERAIDVIEAMGKSRSVAEEELRTVRLATHGDNLNFFGLRPEYRGEKGSDLFRYFWRRYSEVMPIPPRPRWSTVAVSSIVRRVPLRGAAHRAEPRHDFGYCQDKAHQRPLSSKSLQVTFPTNGSKLSARAKRDIEQKFGHLAEIYYEDCIRLDGNTDDVGRRSYNLALSKRRAEAVKRYLVERHGFDPRRIVTVGHGPDRPIASNASEAGRARNRRTDFELLH